MPVLVVLARRARLVLPAAGLAVAACSPLGTMPATTGISPVPAPRTEVELQAGQVPGYFLSSAAGEDPEGSSPTQLAVVFQPGSVLGVRGFFAGGRAIGPPYDLQYEPMIGYRRAVASGIAVVAVVHGTSASTREDGASYSAVRVGGEVGVDLRLGRERRAEPHVLGGVSVAAFTADASYCTSSASGYATDCGGDDDSRPRTEASASGVYPTLTAGVALHGLRHRRGIFHGGRLVLTGAGGYMPRVIAGRQEDAVVYVAAGLAVSIAFGVR